MMLLLPSPLKNVPDLVRLTLACDDLQSVAQCDAPALTGQRTQFSNVVQIDESVAVNALEVRTTESLLDYVQWLVCQQPLSGRYNPDQLSLGLKRQNLIRVKKDVILSASANYLAASGGVRRRTHGCNLCHLVSDFNRMLQKLFGSFYGFV